MIELSIEDHAEAHRILWDRYGLIEDLLAWKGLLGLLTKEEIVHEALSNAGKIGVQCRPTTNKGKKYNWKIPPKPKGTGGMMWFHNPYHPSEKCCIRADETPPEGWIRGQGKKSINPGLNFHKNRVKDIDMAPPTWLNSRASVDTIL